MKQKHLLITGQDKENELKRLFNKYPKEQCMLLDQDQFLRIAKTGSQFFKNIIFIEKIYDISEIEEMISFMDWWNVFNFIFSADLKIGDIRLSGEFYNIIVADKIENTSWQLTDQFNHIRLWAKDKGILDKGNSLTQFAKLIEECGELGKAIILQNDNEYKDAIGDIVIVLTSLAHFKGFTIEECINSAYEVVSKRTGKMINNNFVKDAE